MGAEDNSFMDKVRSSFSKVKEDIENHSNELKEIKKAILEQKEDNLSIKSELKEIKALLNAQKSISTGNDGVSAQRATTSNNAQSTTTHDQKQQKRTPIEALSLTEFEKRVLSLTDREFSVFVAIYELSNEHGYTTYDQLSERLKVTDSPIRHLLTRLQTKQMPIRKERVLHGKVSLSMIEGYMSPTLLSKLMRLRQDYSEEQTRLIK